jgi:hypothetical protein
MQLENCTLAGLCGSICPSACVPVTKDLHVCCRAFEDAEQDSCQQLGCAACPAGTFSNVSGVSSCEKCPQNSISAPGSNNQSDCKCAPGFVGPDGGYCTKCQAGKFKAIAGSASACIDCEPGKFAPDDSATTCMLCSGGNISVNGSIGCTGDALTIKISLLLQTNTSHFALLKTQYAKSIAEWAGVSLSDVFGGDSTVATRGLNVTWNIRMPRFHATRLRHTTLVSRLGEIGPVAALTDWQEGCGSGREPAENTCILCPEGKFKNATDNSSCIACRNLSTTKGQSSISESDCQCQAGYFLHMSTNMCAPCPAGSFKLFGPGDCQECEEGKYSLGTFEGKPSTSCTFCPLEAYRSPRGSESKDECF